MLNAILPKIHTYRWWLGTALVATIAIVSQLLSELSFFQSAGLGALTIAIVVGMLVGNTLFPRIAEHTHVGVDYAKNILLRAGIILYGFRITFGQITHVGWAGIIIDAIVVCVIFFLAQLIGQRVFKMDKESTILIGAGSAICGAAAVMATEPVIKAPAHKVTVAVATVVVFGTLSLFLSPLLYPYLGLNDHQFGIYLGSTIHEVAQVVAASKNISETAAESAVIVKMIRVMMLVPFLIALSAWLSKKTHIAGQQKSNIMIPWFAVLFIVASGVTSLHIIPDNALAIFNQLSTLLLAMAMAALGLRTHFSAIKQAGLKPLFLASVLFVVLIVGGALLNKWVLPLFA